MKQCPNCNGPLDDKGKCIVCGTSTKLDLSDEDGVVLNKIPEELSKVITPAPSESENILRTLNRLTYEAEYEDEKIGHKSNLKFELGINIVHELQLESMVRYYEEIGFNPKINQKTSLVGIPVEINYDEPDMIKLWKEVKI